MEILHFNSLLLSSLVTLIFISTTYGALQQGFTLDLIHRDSPNSPLHNASLNKSDRVKDIFHRSVSRINHFNPSSPLASFTEDMESKVIPARGEYVMEVSVGTPPVKQLWIVDTGSDLIWTQCQPCLKCYKQLIPIFNPRKSSTYKVQPCESKACQNLGHQGSCSTKGTCGYTYSYGDNSQTLGDLATDTLTFGAEESASSTSVPRVSFGCGYDNEGTFGEQGSGLIGLGNGPVSLTSQLSASIGGKKFSYCLIPLFQQGNYTSKINFGDKGTVTGRGVVSTPLVKKTPDTFYFLTLEGFSVGGKTIYAYPNHKYSLQPMNDFINGQNEGNIIIDSGTTLTLLPSDLYDELAYALSKAIDGNQVEDPTRTLEHCYEATKDLNIPNIIAHFSGADLVLHPYNTFVQISDGVVCLAMVPSDSIAIFGNLAQGNFLVGYDIDQGIVSFKPTDCTKGQ